MIVIGNIFFKQKVGSSFKIVIILCLYIGYTVQQCILGNCLFTSLVISVLYNMADPEVTLLQSGNVEPMPDNSTRKRKRRVDNWKKTKDKKKRHSAQGFPNIPTCGHRERANGSKHCYDCSRLNMQDIRRFHQGFYKSCNKIDQDQFILRYAKGKVPKRHRLQGPHSSERGMAIEYFIPSYRNEGGSELVKVCQKAFLDILNISKFRVQRLCRLVLQTGESPKELRGGDHRSKKSEEKLSKVKTFIEALQPVESHYCRGKSRRQYLASHLSISSLWKSYNNTTENEFKVKYEYFRKIFVENYNVGFGSPATDQCSQCLKLKEKILSVVDFEEKGKLKIELQVHKKRGKMFFELLQSEEAGTITFSFDCQKNLIFPKLTDQAAYFLRQFYVYNFTMCLGSSLSKQTVENTFIYAWTEMEGAKGSSEIASCVRHRLSETVYPENVHTIRLFADGAGGQNKNTILITALLNWLLTKAPQHIKTIVIHYPVPGHSYIPPDRVFGVIERKVRKVESITHPNTYFDIFRESGTVNRLGLDFDVENWMEVCRSTVKKPGQWHFKFSTCKRFILTRGKKGNGLVRGEVAYKNDIGASRGIAKKGCSLRNINPQMKPNSVQVNPAKVKDVKTLLRKHYGEQWDQLEFLRYYADLFTTNDGENQELNQDDPNEHEDPMEDEVLILEGNFAL
ncbi:uncharacterized protein LOC124362930 [Homalodisca vitripennis]|uniref:uncharacterized protein LOC124362930 n=1 Tax=Homalodisca vitripennis TaxID=197043 RepID=UPI001EEBC6BF|nr:uncharacterized protein LOC124362930 [Homalodisca vitripennis]